MATTAPTACATRCANPRVALMFLVPGVEETLRVFGAASVVGPTKAERPGRNSPPSATSRPARSRVRNASAGIEWVITQPAKEPGRARAIATPIGPASTATVSRRPTRPAACCATRSRPWVCSASGQAARRSSRGAGVAPPWTTEPLVVSGAVLGSVGLPMPTLAPQQAMVVGAEGQAIGVL